MNAASRSLEERLRLAEAVRDACVRAALEAYEDAGLSGLCQEGRWECAVEAIRDLDVEQIARALAVE